MASSKNAALEHFSEKSMRIADLSIQWG